uniref:uncharacterized protein LOC120327063 n=1 Tax=Styela clava TaxID=7725 RepID=UPI00193ACC69|nr:uncharacterized protein LOC120327063 [Styela clava]
MKHIFILPMTIVFLLLLGTSPTKSTPRIRKCYVNKKAHPIGSLFQHEYAGCQYRCKCAPKKYGHRIIPKVVCFRSCPSISFPYCCKLISDGCCPKSYHCEYGECCKDQQTGDLYKMNESWKYNDTCNCTCLGEGRGASKCVCSMSQLENQCAPDPTSKCYACGSGKTDCPVRQKCETYTKIYSRQKFNCTCYGSYTRCKFAEGKPITRSNRHSASIPMFTDTDILIFEGLFRFQPRIVQHIEL